MKPFLPDLARSVLGFRWHVLLICSALAAAGCQTIGPANMQRDRIDYGGAIADSWKEQTLLNITKLRYSDTPVFLEVSSVISSYTLQSELSLAARIFPHSRTDTYRNLGATGTYTDRPTISYTPVTGQKYIDALLRPIIALHSRDSDRAHRRRRCARGASR
jgi:hypothetical protein